MRVIRDHRLLAEVPLVRTLRVGRLPDNDIVIDDELVSGHHGRIEFVEGNWRYVDLGSTNGSIVAAGPTLRRNDCWPLHDDSQILLGATVLDVRVVDERAASTIVVGRPDVGTPPRAARAPAPPARLFVQLGGRGTMFELPPGHAGIGRARDNDVPVEHPSVSAHHAEIHWDGGRYLLRDLGSTNGTRLGLQRVAGPRELPSGSHLIAGEVDMLFVVDGAPQPDAHRVLAVLVRDGRIGRAAARRLRRQGAQAPGRPLVERLLVEGLVTPGEWVEAASAAQQALERAPPRRAGLWALLALAAAAALWWVLR